MLEAEITKTTAAIGEAEAREKAED